MKNARFTRSPCLATQLSPGPVLRPAGVRFPQDDVRNSRARRQRLHLPRALILKILRHVFRRRIHGLERFEIVHELVVEPAHDLANRLLELCEIHQESGRVELWPFERHTHAIIMAMHVLTLAAVTAQGVPRRKSLFYADLKHFSPNRPGRLSRPPLDRGTSGWTCRMGLKPPGSAFRIEKPRHVSQLVRHSVSRH